MTAMKRYLIITPVDVSRMANNREHHLLSHVASRFDEVFVVYRKRCEKGGLGQVLKNALLPQAKVEWRDGICFIEVNPLLNHAQGLAMNVAGTYQMTEEADKRRSWRQHLFRLLSSVGIWKDMFTIFFLFWFSLRKVPGTIDVCTAMAPWGNTAAWLLRRLGKVRLWAYEDRDYEPGFINTPLRRCMAEKLEVMCLKRADLCISIGYRLQHLREKQSHRHVELVTTGVDASAFQAPQCLLDNPVLVYTGNVTFWSGLDMVLAALPEIRKVVPGVTLLIVGESLQGYREELDKLVDRFDLGQCLTFTGRVPNADVPGYLAQSYIGVATFQPLSFRQYAFPLKVLEYMAAGLPSIGTQGTETEDILKRHEFGVSVAYDVDAFAKAAIDLLCDEQKYQVMAQNARDAAQDFDWSKLMEREYDLLTKAWKKRYGDSVFSADSWLDS